MSDLGKDALDLLGRVRESESYAPSADDEARVRAKLAAKLGVALGAATLTTTQTASALGTAGVAAGAKAGVATGVKATVATSLVAKWTAVAVVVGAVGGGSAYVVVHGEGGTSSTTVATASGLPASPTNRAVRPMAPASAPVLDLAPSAAPTEAVSAPTAAPAHTLAVTPTSAHAPSPERDQEAPQNVEDPLVVELRLMHDAQAAMARGDAASALAKVSEHAQRFPSGSLTPEREGTRVLALCAAGRTDEARSAGKRFLGAYGRSPLAERVRHSCATETQ